MASSLDRGYLTLAEYLNCNATQQNAVNQYFYNFFQQPKLKIKEPLQDNGLRFFIALALFDPRSQDMRCMGHNSKRVRCSNKAQAHELCISMQRLWEILRDSTLQDQNLRRELYDVGKHFLCEGAQHRREVHGKIAFAEELVS